MLKWKILEEEDVSPSTQWYPVKRHTVQLANGHIVDDYYVSDFGAVAMVLPLTVENNIVLVKQYKHGIRDFCIELPAGFKQKGKSVQESAIAELEEETGILTNLENLEYIGKVCHTPTKTNHQVTGYLARNLSFNSVQNFDETEEIEVIVKTPKEVLAMVRSGEIWVSDSVCMILLAQLKFPAIFK